jgi:calcineurin-like phosphoesterase family protein
MLASRPDMHRRPLRLPTATLSLILLVGGVAWARPNVDVASFAAPQPVLAGASTANASAYPLGTASFTAGHLYVAFLHLSEAGSAVDPTPGLIGVGTSWTQLSAPNASAGVMGLSAYVFAPSADIADVTLSTGALSVVHEGFCFTVVDVPPGFAPASPIVQSRGVRADPTQALTASLSLAPRADSLVLAAFAHGAAEGSTPGTGWTEVAGSDLSHLSPTRGAHVVYDDTAPSASASSSWATKSRARALLIEIRADAPEIAGVRMAAAGDICGGLTACTNTSNRVADFAPDVVITTGDLAYSSGLSSEFQTKYGGGTTPASGWGRPSIKDITLPGYGNHDCYDVPRTTGATKQGCTDAVAYFGPDAQFGTDIPGTSGSYYTVRGQWLIVHLNSAGDVGSGEATPEEIASQNAALQEVLAADQHVCEIVVWHHPRFSSGGDHGDSLSVDPWFDTAFANGVDIVLNGHDHDYERFEPQDGDGNAVADGVREFVVGTGGATPEPFGIVKPNSAVQIVDRGILTMELLDDGTYSWAFLDDVTAAVDDAGSGVCH